MKKFLLSSLFAFLLITEAFAQTVSCPSNAKRNNGNNCTSGGTGGQLEVEFPTAPDARLQIALIVNSNGTATIIESTKQVSTRAGNTFITWCFETDNLGPIVQGSVQYQFYLDLNGNNQQDLPAEASFMCSQASLPVTLINFSAAQQSGKVSLAWQTAQELNNKEFQVERRLSAGGFETIATVPSKAMYGNSGSVLNYSFDDLSNLEGKGQVYYRIKQVDMDAHVNYSEIRSIHNNSKNFSLTIYPNPGREPKVTIPDGVGIVDISVSDMNGKEVKRWNSTILRSLQLQNLRSGLYTIKVDVKETGDVLVDKILIQ